MHLNIRILFCLIAVMLLGNFLHAQTLKGVIKDGLGIPIAYGNVIAKYENSNAIIAFTSSNDKGAYALNFKKKGVYKILFSALSYKKDSISISFGDNKIIERDIILKEQITTLNEVIVQTDLPITIKEDTIVYKVKTFLKGNEVVVEDILKNLPGITVDSDGTIKIGQQEIENIMVEGDDFFKKGYKLLSKNLSAIIVDKVEIYQKYSNNKLLKGIEDSNKVALNLTLKEDRKIDWFGNMSIDQGYGNNYLYAGKVNLMRFGKKAKHYFLGNANNIGEPSAGESIFYADASDIKDVGTVGNGQFSNKLINLQGFNISLKQNRYNFNNAEMVSFNSIFKLSEKAKLKTNILLDWDEMEYQQNNIQRFNTGSEEFENIEKSRLLKDKFKSYAELDFDYEKTASKLLEIDTKITKQTDETTNSLNFNTTNNNESLADNNQRLDQKIVFTNKLNLKTALVLSGRYIFEEAPQDYFIDNFLYQNLFPTVNAQRVQQISNNKMNVLGLESHLLSRTKTKNLLEVKVGFSYRSDRLRSQLVLLNEDESEAPSDYANNLKYNVADLYAFAKYKFVFGEFSINPKLALHQIANRKTSFDNELSQSVFFINPSIAFDYNLNKVNNFNLTLSNSTSNANLINVLDNYILQNFRTFYRGTSDFNQIELSRINFNYSLGNWSSSFFANFNIGYLKNHDFFSTNNTVEQNNSQIDAIVIEDRDQFLTNLKIDQYLSFLSSNLKLNLQYLQSDYKNIVNSDDLRRVKNSSYSYGLELM